MALKMTTNVYSQNKWRQVWKDDLFLFLLSFSNIKLTIPFYSLTIWVDKCQIYKEAFEFPVSVRTEL